MSIKIGEIYSVYKSKGWDAFKTDIKTSEKEIARAAKRANHAIQGSEAIFVGAAIGIVASMASITAAVVKIGMPFETMVLEAGSAMRATQAEMERLEAAARRAGATTEHTATQAAESLKFLGKAGLTARESMESLGGMLNFKTAIGSVMDLGRATDVITDSMISMGLETKDLTHLTDLFVGASNRSSTNAAQIGEAFSKVAGIAKVYGMEVETLTATIAIQASAGIKSGIAGRQLKNAFAAASTAAAELGIKNEGLIPTLRAVEKAGWDADKVMGTFGRIAMPSVVAIMSKVSGTEKGSFSYMLNEMNHVSDGMGETAIQAEKMRASVENQFAIVTSMIQDIALSIFDDWKPAMLDGIKTTQDFLRENKKAIVEVGDVLLPVLQRVGQVIQAAAWLGVNAFGMLNMKVLEFTDYTMRAFIEIEFAAKIAWGGMQSAFGLVIEHMLSSFARFTAGMSAAFKLIGGYDIAGPLDRATMQLKMAAKGTDELTGALGRALDERKKAISVHKKIIDEIALENQGYTTTADESRKAAESVLADIRAKDEASGGYTRKQMADMNAVSARAIVEADARLKTDQEFYNKSGMMSAEMHKRKLEEIEASVTRFRLGSSTEIQIQAWKEKEIAKLNKATTGRTTKQLAAESKAVAVAVKRDLKAREKGVEERLKIEFGWLDKVEESTNKEIKALEKSLGVSRNAYEKYITEKTGLKELSVETEARLDEEYSDLLWKTLQGDTENFTASQKAMVAGKGFTIEGLKKYDQEYFEYLISQEEANADIRLGFYEKSGIFSQEYYDSEIVRIGQYSETLRAAGVAAVDIERQKTDAILALDVKKLESTNTFFAGFRLAAIESSQDMMTWADVGQSAFNTIQSSLEQGFGDAFQSLMEGPDTSELEAQLEGLQDEYAALGASITDVNAQIVDTERATQDAIRDSHRETMTEFELFQDDKLKYAEITTRAETALLAENFQLAQELFVEAQGVAATLAREVSDEAAKAINETTQLTSDAFSEITSEFSGLTDLYGELASSVDEFGKESSTAFAQSSGLLNSLSDSTEYLEEQMKHLNFATALGDVGKMKSQSANIEKIFNDIFKAGEKSIDNLMGEWDTYQKKVEDVNQEIAGINLSTEEKIRELKRGTMSDMEQFYDQRLEFDETYSEASRELEKGNFEYASELYEKSIGLAEELATDSVNTLEDNTDLAIELMQKASSGASIALTQYQDSMGANMVSIEGAVTDTMTAMESATQTLSGLPAPMGVAVDETISSLEENTGVAIGLMEDAGIGATDALKLEQEALSANMDMIGGEIEGVSNKIGEESDKIALDWGGLWSGMVETVAVELGNIAAKWAAAKVAQGAVAGADWLINQFTSAEDGAFDVGRTGPGAAMAGGGIPILAHPGESILPKELTDQVKSGIGFDEFKESLRGYFGLDEGEASSLWNQASEYKGAGASLYKAWESFDSGDNVGGIVEAMNAMSEAFETYGQQQGSQIATNIGQGLGEGAGAISAGYGAYTAFEQEDYLTAVTQSLQAVQSAISLASTVSGTTVGAGAGAALGAAGTAATGAGIGLAAWNLLSEFAGIEGGDKAPAQWGAAAGGAALGTMVGGYVGTIVGALIGGVGGTSYSVATENEFDLSDLDSWINTNRTVSGGKISALPPSVDPTWFGVAQQRYYDHLNLQALAVNQLTDTVSGELTEADAKKFQSSIDAVISGINIDSGGNYNRNRADQMVIGVGNYYWNETVDAIGSVVSGTEGLSQGRKSEILELMAGTEPAYYINPIDQPENIRRYEEERAAADPVYATWLRNKALAQEERNISGGAATGGVVVPSGEDGYLGVRKEEGIFSVAAMQWAEDVGNTILKTGGVFGGTEARFDSPGMGTPTGGADIFGGDARNAQMSELLLNDQVTRQGRTNEILESQLSESRRTNTILENIVNVLLEGDEEKIRTLKAIVAKPPGVTKYDLNPLFTMSRVYMSQPRSNFGFG